jgi:hypothetical protein
MSRPGPAVRATVRLLGLLAVVLGLLAMHGLASTHHAAAAVHAHAAAPATVADEPRPAHEATAPHRRAAAATGSWLGVPPGAACADHCPDALVAVCVAVLAATAAATALVRAAAVRRALLPAWVGRDLTARLPATPRWLLPGPDPVAELCVSRT